ncbi:unnamed protein product, partial [Chrysoparadoxa australica]
MGECIVGQLARPPEMDPNMRRVPSPVPQITRLEQRNASEEREPLPGTWVCGKAAKVEQIACGDSFTALRISSGGVLTCGRNNAGQLGLGRADRIHEHRLQNLKLTKHVMHVACGAEHAAAVTGAGELWVWGSGTGGKLGIGSGVMRHSPRKVVFPDDVRVQTVAC